MTIMCVITIDEWKCDQYRWINQGVTKLPRREPVLRKMYFSLNTPEGPSKLFQRYAYQLMEDKSMTLIHYLGNEKNAIDFPHGNQKHDVEGKKHVRTCPSYLNKFKSLVKSQTTSIAYKKEISNISCDPECVATCTPRNLKQLRNLRYQHLNQLKISQDTLYNLHEISYDIPGFIWKINTFPDLVCICGLKEILTELDKVLLLDSNFQLLSYDTTFQLGDFH